MEEMSGIIGGDRGSQWNELVAIISGIGRVDRDENGEGTLVLQTERAQAVTKCFTLLQKTANIICMLDNSENAEDSGTETALKLPEDILGRIEKGLAEQKKIRNMTHNDRTAAAYIRGMYLALGSTADPEREYQLEFACRSEEQGSILAKVLKGRGIDLRQMERKAGIVLYTRDADVEADVLTLAGAHTSLLELENARIMKQLRGNVNRQVNCETANIKKTVSAARKQMDDILLLQERGVLSTLPENLREMAALRLQYPESSLQELGGHLVPPVGKSGVNHRLRRLSEAADKVRLAGASE